MRDRFAKILYIQAAVNGMTIFHEENGMRHGSVVPLLAVPDFIHRGGRVGLTVLNILLYQ